MILVLILVLSTVIPTVTCHPTDGVVLVNSNLTYEGKISVTCEKFIAWSNNEFTLLLYLGDLLVYNCSGRTSCAYEMKTDNLFVTTTYRYSVSTNIAENIYVTYQSENLFCRGIIIDILIVLIPIIVLVITVIIIVICISEFLDRKTVRPATSTSIELQVVDPVTVKI
jgi:hypothetical protein